MRAMLLANRVLAAGALLLACAGCAGMQAGEVAAVQDTDEVYCQTDQATGSRLTVHETCSDGSDETNSAAQGSLRGAQQRTGSSNPPKNMGGMGS